MLFPGIKAKCREMWQTQIPKVVDELIDEQASKVVLEWNNHLDIFSLILLLSKFLGNVCFFEQIFYRKRSLGACTVALLNVGEEILLT